MISFINDGDDDYDDAHDGDCDVVCDDYDASHPQQQLRLLLLLPDLPEHRQLPLVWDVEPFQLLQPGLYKNRNKFQMMELINCSKPF